MSQETFLKTLTDLGLTRTDSQVYLFLAKRGIQQARDIAKALKMNKQQLYRSLTNLQSRGIVDATLEHPARFSAIPFDKVLDLYVRAKTEEAQAIQRSKEEILSVWRSIAAGDTDVAARFMVIEGRNIIYSRIQQMIKETKNQLLTISTVPGLVRADQFGLFDVSSELLSKSKIQFRFLTDLSEQNVAAVKALLGEMANSKMSFSGRTPSLGLEVFPRMVIRDEEEALFFITSTAELPTTEQDSACLWTNSKALVNAFTAMFESLWHNSTDIQKKISEIETGKLPPTTYIISNAQTAQIKYEEVMNSAQKEILVMTSSKGLMIILGNISLLKESVKKGIAVKIMAPITSENHDAALQLSDYAAVKHVPTSYLETAIIDGKHLFQFKTPPSGQEKLDGASHFENTFYSDDLEYVERAGIMLADIWKNASVLSGTTLEKVLGSSAPNLTRPLRMDANKISGRKLTCMYCLLAAEAIIHPLSELKMPDVLIDVFRVGKKSTFGASVAMVVSLRDEASPFYSSLPVAILDTNPHPNLALVWKSVYAGTPAAQNVMIVKPYELELYKRGKTVFAGWTVSIPLPPTPLSLPPSCLVFEGHGNPKHLSRAYDLPSGYCMVSEWNVRDAFLTFMSPSRNYAGPATEGMMGKHVASLYGRMKNEP